MKIRAEVARVVDLIGNTTFPTGGRFASSSLKLKVFLFSLIAATSVLGSQMDMYVLSYAKDGDGGGLQGAVGNGGNINIRDASGMTPLMIAARVNDYQHQDTCKILLEYPNLEVNAVDQRGYTALRYAIEAGNQKAIDMLTARGADVHGKPQTGSGGGGSSAPYAKGGFTTGDALFWSGIVISSVGWFMQLGAAFAAGFGWVVVCFVFQPLFILLRWKDASKGFLTQVGGLVICCVGMYMGITNASGWLVEMAPPLKILRNQVVSVEKKPVPAPEATQQKPSNVAPSIQGLDTFKDKDASITTVSTSKTTATDTAPKPTTVSLPLIEAAKKGDAGQVVKLLESGEAVNTVDAEGWTALMHAASKGSNEAVQALLNKGADVNAKDSGGWTALILAAYGGNRAVVQSLLDKGADVKATTSRKTTALICAAGGGHSEVVQALIDAKADVDARDADGKTALRYATDKKHAAVIEILKKAGSKEEVSSSPPPPST